MKIPASADMTAEEYRQHVRAKHWRRRSLPRALHDAEHHEHRYMAHSHEESKMEWRAPEDRIRAALATQEGPQRTFTESELINYGYLPHGWSGAAAYRARALDDKMLAGRDVA